MDRIVVSKYNQIRYLGSILQKNVEIDNDWNSYNQSKVAKVEKYYKACYATVKSMIKWK
jgi:hypothetical protein